MNKKLFIESELEKGFGLKEIGAKLEVSRQRIYQLMVQYGIKTPIRRSKGFWKKQSPEHKWLWRLLCRKSDRSGLSREENWKLFQVLSKEMPEHCPILGMKLEYDILTKGPATANPSIDRKDPTKGYTPENTHIISQRANWIKSNLTKEELIKVLESLG